MQYDVIVIGSGPGGYVAAIRCAHWVLKPHVSKNMPATAVPVLM